MREKAIREFTRLLDIMDELREVPVGHETDQPDPQKADY
jgi:hypothetical protein